MYGKQIIKYDQVWLFLSLIGISILYLNLIWRTTGNVDQITTSCIFWVAILWLLWRKRHDFKYRSDPVASFVGLLLLGGIIAKTFTLFWFESVLIPLLPISAAIALALIASGFAGIGQYLRELFFAWFLFFPTGVIGRFLDGIVHITILNAKFATYFLYYLGFDVISRGNQVLLSLPKLGEFMAIVDYPCAGVPLILLMLKLSLLLVSFASLPKNQRVLIPLFSVVLGFLLGVIRVCILTLLIPNQAQFAYWHGAQGSQIFSTLAIIIFSGYCYWILEREQVMSNE